MTRNVTFTADADLLDEARAAALEQNTTLNAQFRVWLEQLVRERRAARALAVVDRLAGYASSGGRHFSRDEMNERR